MKYFCFSQATRLSKKDQGCALESLHCELQRLHFECKRVSKPARTRKWMNGQSVQIALCTDFHSNFPCESQSSRVSSSRDASLLFSFLTIAYLKLIRFPFHFHLPACLPSDHHDTSHPWYVHRVIPSSARPVSPQPAMMHQINHVFQDESDVGSYLH